jgi:hypothetical protein
MIASTVAHLNLQEHGATEPCAAQSIGDQVRRQTIVGILEGRSPSWGRLSLPDGV